MTRLAFGEWLPDLPEFENPGALTAKNCIPEVSSYRSLSGLAPISDAIPDIVNPQPTPNNAIASAWARTDRGDIFNFVGTQAAIYRLSAGANWFTVARPIPAGADFPYNAVNWDFTQFGNRVLAASIDSPIQYYDMAAATQTPGVINATVRFQDLPNAPNATYVDVVRDFVVAGNVDDGARRQSRVRWSGFNNSEQWESSAVTQAGFQDLRGRGGRVQRVIGGDVGIIFQERSITRMSYIGPPILFRFDEVERDRGTQAPNSVVWTGSDAFYYAADGFYRLNLYGGTNSEPIGANRVNNWFRRTAAPDEIENMRGTIDFKNSLVIWAFKSTSNADINDTALIYNWQANRWSYADVEIRTLSEFISPGYNLDELVEPLPQGLDLQSIIVDSTEYSTGDITAIAFDAENRASVFAGPPLDVCLDTKEFSNEDSFTFIRNVRPLVESGGDGLMVTPVTRNRIVDPPKIGDPRSVNAIGQCDLRVNARYHRYRITGAVPFTHANGVEFTANRRGRR